MLFRKLKIHRTQRWKSNFLIDITSKGAIGEGTKDRYRLDLTFVNDYGGLEDSGDCQFAILGALPGFSKYPVVSPEETTLEKEVRTDFAELQSTHVITLRRLNCGHSNRSPSRRMSTGHRLQYLHAPQSPTPEETLVALHWNTTACKSLDTNQLILKFQATGRTNQAPHEQWEIAVTY
ncbi:hypothetical protein L218DRAFT_941568 [Marasmius fiardii PR-910]|nr:hypothetical protein L218DRAFT_941568 [Marasmius fiardii PR-910]